jgi:hypothetical protein
MRQLVLLCMGFSLRCEPSIEAKLKETPQTLEPPKVSSCTTKTAPTTRAHRASIYWLWATPPLVAVTS